MITDGFAIPTAKCQQDLQHNVWCEELMVNNMKINTDSKNKNRENRKEMVCNRYNSGLETQQVETFKYLGRVLSSMRNLDLEVNDRIQVQQIEIYICAIDK